MLSHALLLSSLWLSCDATPIYEKPARVIEARQDASSTASGDVTVATPVQRIFLDADNCDDGQRKTIEQAWKDAGELAKAAQGGRLDYDYNIPKTQWLGKDYNWPGWFPFSSDYRDIINRDIGRQATLHPASVGSGIWIYITCPKKHDVCSPGTIAASSDNWRGFWTNHYTIFCPIFFTDYPSLSASLDKVKDNSDEQQIMNNYWGNQGYTFFHETYHYGTTVSVPRTKDLCYGPEGCWEMVADSGKGTKWAIENADSFTLEAMAIYAQQHFNTPHPPVPRKYTIALTDYNTTLLDQAANPTNATVPSEGEDTGSAAPQETAYYKALDSVPEDLFGSFDDVNAAGQNLPARWTQMTGPPLETPAPSSSEAPAPSSTEAPPPPSTPTPDMNSDACKACTDTLGASDCKADDMDCLHNQCKDDNDCKTCGLDCNTVG